MHTGNRKILVQLQNNVIHTLDIRIYRFLTSYNANNGEKYGIFDDKLPDPMSTFDDSIPATSIVDTPLIKSSFSPCGYQLWSSDQSGSVQVYKSDTGDLTTIYDLGNVVDIAYHPFDHIVAFCAFGDGMPVVLYTWDENEPQKEILSIPEHSHEVNEPSEYFSGERPSSILRAKLQGRKTEISSIADLLARSLTDINASPDMADIPLPESANIGIEEKESADDERARRKRRHSRKRKERRAEQERIARFDGQGREAEID
jgi:hypothetical protein